MITDRRKGRLLGAPGRAIWLGLAATMVCAFLPIMPAAANAVGTVQVGAADLVARPDVYAGQMVTMTEEVIGEVMYQGERAWVNVGGEGSAVGVWLEGRLADKIRICGSYGHRGDTVRVTGIFHVACAEHGGDPDLHALELEVVAPGGTIPRPLSKVRWALGLCLCSVGLVVTLADRSRNRLSARR